MARDLHSSPLDPSPWVPSLAPGGFDVEVEPGAEPVVRLRGELDLAGVGQLEGTAFRLLDAGAERVVLDLAELEFLDVSGVNALLGLDRAAKAQGGRLVLRHPRPQARKVLRDTRAVSSLDVEEERAR